VPHFVPGQNAPDSVAGVTTRNLQFSRLFNFRDLGGTRTADGYTVRYGQVYRSDSLHALDEADHELWRDLGIRTVLDLRRPAEIEKWGRVPEWDGVDWRHVHLRHQAWEEIPWRPADIPLAGYLRQRYLAMSTESAPDIAVALSVIADPAAAPVVVHCMAGKDRTGLVCALTLSLLGVPDEDVAQEYALTSPNIDRLRAILKAAKPERTNLDSLPLDTPVAAMRDFLADLRDQHGSVEAYVRAIGVPDGIVPALREHLLD
jgi:protein-tyrosine phosphatase